MKTMGEVSFRSHEKSCCNCGNMNVVNIERVFESQCKEVGTTNISADLFRIVTWTESRLCDEWIPKEEHDSK